MSASAGRVLIMPKGDFNSQSTYSMLDFVLYNGKSYVCKKTSTGNLPTNTEYWQLMLDSAGSLADLSDVDLLNPQNGDLIVYNATRGIWVNDVATSISITTPPDQTVYTVGDSLDLTGIVVTATYVSGITKDVTQYSVFTPPNNTVLTSSNTQITATWNGLTATTPITVSAPIYGVEWDGTSSSSMTRIEASADFVDPVPYYSGITATPSSPFDSIYPWSEIERVEDSSAGTLVKIPKYYYRWDRNGSTMTLRISQDQFEHSLVSPAHADRGDGQGERDYVYVGAYKCNSDDYKSVSGKSATYEPYDASTCRTNISGLASDVWMYDFAMFWTIGMLYLVEYADWNVQAKIGAGGGSDNGSAMNKTTGYCDTMPYHTGTMSAKNTTYSRCRYRYIEDLWGINQDIIDGIAFSSGNLYMRSNPADYTWANVTGATFISGMASTSGYIKTWTTPIAPGFEYAMFPLEVASSETYVKDYFNYKSSKYAVTAGGSQYETNYQQNGLFRFTIKSSSDNSIGSARLMKLPANS